jgi:5-methylcytosine-specific restriction endonuclease McrA
MSNESSPRQETADCDTQSDDKEVSCPTCGDTFGSTQYMKVHHSHAHGESIAGDLIECDWCGDEFRRNPSATDGANYCSDECASNGRSERYTGDGHPRYDGGKETVTCEYCESQYGVWPTNAEKSRFCSTDCKAEWQSENVGGETHPQYNSVKVGCYICDETVRRKPSHLKEQERVFCSYDCHREYQSRHQVGEGHHMYEGGRSKEYGPNWDEQAAKARHRDNYRCQDCGAPQSEFDRALSVHHIIPRKMYTDAGGEYDYERGNRLENLVTLCGSCHSKREAVTLKPDTR